MTYDLSHLHSIELRLSHERARLANAATDAEREMRKVWVAATEKELSDERDFLRKRGVEIPGDDPVPMTDDELLAALGELDELLKA